MTGSIDLIVLPNSSHRQLLVVSRPARTAKMEIDGIRFHVLHEGDTSKPLVVLCHALMANLHIWDSTVVALHRAGFSTLRYDHIGHGKTSPPTEDRVGKYDFDDYCRHIHQLVERVTPGNKPYAFVGCSMGGVLALRYPLLYPGEFKKLISCDAPGATALEEAKPLWHDRMATFKAKGVEALTDATIARWFPDPCPEEVKKAALELTKTCSYPGYVTCAEAIMKYDFTEELGKIQDEVMVLAGENDASIGPRSILDDVASRIKGSKRVLMKDTGHIPPMHQPEDFERIVVAYLKG